MQTRNPVLSRIGRPQGSGGSGFAYDEGRTAYTAAATAGASQSDQTSAADLQRMYEGPTADGKAMTLDDVVVKTGICLAITIAMAVVGWNLTPSMPWLMWVAMLVGLGLGFANALMRKVTPVLVLLYAAVEGLFLGGISWFYNELAIANQYEGLVQQAVLGTLVAFAVMLTLYQTKIIKVNATFMKAMIVAMVSYAGIAVVSFISALFGVGGDWGFYGVGLLGIALCALGVALASLSLALDFEMIKQGVAQGLPERESWRMAFGLLVTLIWLYLEILRLLAIISSNNR